MRLAIQMPIQFALPTEVACLSVGFADSHRESEHHGERQARTGVGYSQGLSRPRKTWEIPEREQNFETHYRSV